MSRLGDEFDFRIVTADRDAFDTEPYDRVAINTWNTVGRAKVFYASPSMQSLNCLARLMRETPHHLFYLNSFFDPVFTVRPLLARVLGLAPKLPTIIAPRGEFSQGALKLKAWKKHLYFWISKIGGLYLDLRWQASSEHEVEDIRRALGKTAKIIVIAPDLPTTVHVGLGEGVALSGGGPLRVVFLSRITPIKNLDFVLRVLMRVSAPVELSIYGVIEDDTHWRRCKDLIKALPEHVAVRYYGAIGHDQVADVLSKHHLFFLPTRGENYGHAIHEALSAGLPVLISDQTPWKDLEARGVGWDLPLTAPEAFVAAIQEQALLGLEERMEQTRRATEYAALVASDEETVARNRALFRDPLKI